MSVSYDDNGNLLQSASLTNTWDSANRLVETSRTGSTLQPIYDGLGNRVGQTVGVSTTWYALDVAIGLPEVLYTSEGHNYLHLPGLIMTESDTGEVRYLLSDGLGSVRHAVDEAGTVVAYNEYSPYGEPVGDTETGYGFTGEWWESDIGLLHLRARWYSPEHGVFLSRDPFEGTVIIPQSLNGYNYVHQNPVNWTDPSGWCIPGYDCPGDKNNPILPNYCIITDPNDIAPLECFDYDQRSLPPEPTTPILLDDICTCDDISTGLGVKIDGSFTSQPFLNNLWPPKWPWNWKGKTGSLGVTLLINKERRWQIGIAGQWENADTLGTPTSRVQIGLEGKLVALDGVDYLEEIGGTAMNSGHSGQFDWGLKAGYSYEEAISWDINRNAIALGSICEQPVVLKALGTGVGFPNIPNVIKVEETRSQPNHNRTTVYAFPPRSWYVWWYGK